MRVSIVHFHPLETYPPVMNFINFINDSNPSIESVQINSTSNFLSQDLFCQKKDLVKIHRTLHPSTSRFIISRILLLIYFNLFTLIKLIFAKPAVILYYETFSALPVYVYLRYFRRQKTNLFIHYHEYTSRDEYKNMPAWVRYNYKLEKKYLWKIAEKISHTNQIRLDLFFKDYPYLSISKGEIYPNYPSIKWKSSVVHKVNRKPIRFIYIGSFASLETLYVNEFLEWIKCRNGEALLDVYSFNISNEIQDLLKKLNCEHIQLKGSIKYEEIPLMLKDYDIGVILYKGTTLNFIYNAPNKLFEYLACGLDVWLPDEIEGSRSYVSTNTFPKVMLLNFKRLENVDVDLYISHENLTYKPSDYYCESIYSKLLGNLIHAKR